MMPEEAVPIFLVAETAILSVVVFLAFSKPRKTSVWLAPALAILAGIGMVAFLLYAFAAVTFPTAIPH
jgi:hypothetical protein